ncbi:bifunctional indole-3-glycerol-phosphate synthase TrpC/phosphoribosylanthranilate isomerase TrpF [Alteromonas lipolytica]|uniref:Multifunctional fusion protein n=1 Tax=Alteromonas lipolytica TaxID=1856405 RepID=A0A1E8FFT6_9ALTE|nr:bifunctional indole-3-glycerol-phosphate synthase TrpC/phosphoribosylanthranilate isomerase TrpF [Alteromonas lipolytica]OFI34343.1 bifunctional indole-3-glycerol phosphate synthase/phosphoribosylanthranilate isomerase [Alteromonas lipolytica]GGF82295.1 tryptophan biosynthesis protein TrpCF [Alteromonas lipolytica]
MSNVLEKIVEDKRVEIAARMAETPLEQIKQGLTPSTKSLFDALSAPEAGYILECKKASPSKGLIREHFDLDEILAAYTPFAAGISVLTDEKYFQGSFEYLAYVTERVSQPVLNKDFFVSEYQVYMARYYNADAILLMLSVLDDETYQQLATLADSLGLDILTEVSNEEEMHRAIALKAKIIGINNRNLRDLSTDLATTEKLVPLLESATHDFVVISESGIYTHQDVLRLAPLCQGFLVGSALMAQQDLPGAVKQLVYGTVKVCGMTKPEQVAHAFAAGASYCGLIFATHSKRCVTPEQAREIVTTVPGNYVGVFVNQPLEMVLHIANELNFKAVQLHGDEDTMYRQHLRANLPAGCEIWQAVGVAGEIPYLTHALLDDDTLDKVLLDCQVGKQTGGTGQQFDWSLIHNELELEKLIIAGGINPQNVADAQATGVAIVDVNSGVENAPGDKSPEQISQLFKICRQY